MSDDTTRRRLLATLGAGTVAALAGCSGGDTESPSNETNATNATNATTARETAPSNATNESASAQGTVPSEEGPRNGDDLPQDRNPEDGYPPAFETTFEERDIDPSSFETTTRNGIEVSLVPIDVAYYWFVRGEARFADARSPSEYEQSHVLGAVNSPAGDGTEMDDDPVLSWPTDARVLTYCACPHHLSTLRAASLQEKGYTNVFAIDEGYTPWQERSYPMGGQQPARQPKTWTVSGDANRTAAGETAWAYHLGSGQKEATTIAENGTYELHLKFVNVTADSEVRVETPGDTVTGTLGALSEGTVSADGSGDSRNGTALRDALGF